MQCEDQLKIAMKNSLNMRLVLTVDVIGVDVMELAVLQSRCMMQCEDELKIAVKNCLRWVAAKYNMKTIKLVNSYINAKI